MGLLQLPPISFFRLEPLSHRPHASRHDTWRTKATDDSSPEAESSSDSPPPAAGQDEFESRLSQVRLRYRSGSGKKAEVRKTKKGKKTASTASSASVFLPPVPLKEPSAGGLNVEFGFTPYSERINGRMAILGLSALLLVELASGKTVISYHSPSVVFIQVYFMAAVSAIYVKVEKEKISVWPRSAPSPTRD